MESKGSAQTPKLPGKRGTLRLRFNYYSRPETVRRLWTFWVRASEEGINPPGFGVVGPSASVLPFPNNIFFKKEKLVFPDNADEAPLENKAQEITPSFPATYSSRKLPYRSWTIQPVNKFGRPSRRQVISSSGLFPGFSDLAVVLDERNSMDSPLAIQDKMDGGQVLSSSEVGRPMFATVTEDGHHTDGRASECRAALPDADADICCFFHQLEVPATPEGGRPIL